MLVMGKERRLKNGNEDKPKLKEGVLQVHDDHNDGDEQCNTSQYTKILDIFALTVALTATIALFSLPIVFHFTLRYSSSDTGISNSTGTSPNSSSTSCSTTDPLGSWGQVTLTPSPSSQCLQTGYEYSSDGVCNDYLRQWLQCATVKSSDGLILVNGSDVQADRDNDINSLLPFLAFQPSCRDAAIPFLCQFYFPLKDCSTNSVYTASQQTCLTISTSLCSSLWQLGLQQFPDKLPDCYSLPKSITVSTNGSNTTDAVSSVSSNISCTDGFDRINDSCVPSCDQFSTNPKTTTQVLINSEIIAVTVGLMACVLIAACAVPNYKKMLSFPSIFMLFILVDFVSAAIIVITSAVNRSGLYCSSTSLLESLQSPTFFCSLSGAVFHYTLVGMTLWWFIHIAVFFYKVMLPFHARRFLEDDRNKKLTFAVLTIAGIFLPIVPVIVVLATDGYQQSRFPPSICTPDGGKFFYSASLIINILLCTGVCFLIVIFWVIHTNRHFRSQRGKHQLSTAEKKIMIVFIWFTIFGVFVMIQSGVVSAHSKELVNRLTQYLACESIGDPQNVCDRDFEKYTHPYLLVTTYILLGLIPLSILNFVVNVRVVKGFVKKCCKSERRFRVVGSSDHSSTSTSVNLSTSSKTNDEFKTHTTEFY